MLKSESIKVYGFSLLAIYLLNVAIIFRVKQEFTMSMVHAFPFTAATLRGPLHPSLAPLALLAWWWWFVFIIPLMLLILGWRKLDQANGKAMSAVGLILWWLCGILGSMIEAS